MVRDISKLTRLVYEEQHVLYSKDDTAFRRIYDMYNNSSFPIPKEWFKNKIALDGGCGNAGPFILWLFHQGIKNVYGIDIGDTWMEKLYICLEQRGILRSQLKLKPGNVLDIPYPNNFFDFVTINGVLIHLNNVEEIRNAFCEGARVLKPGGYYYTVYGSCGGVFTDYIFPALRKYYNENLDFKNLIDNLSPDTIHNTIDFILKEHSNRVDETIESKPIKNLFGVDFCVFLKNYIKRPTDFSSICTPEFVEELYKENGFHNIVRHSYYVKRTDIRKFTAPLHYNRDNPLSKILYGHGGVQYLAIKIKDN